MYGFDHRKVYWEPAEHSCSLCLRKRAYVDVSVELRIKVSDEAVHCSGWGVRKRLELQFDTASIVDMRFPVGVLERKHRKGLRHHRHVVCFNHISCLKVFAVLVRLAVLVQFSRRHWCQVTRVLARNANSVFTKEPLSSIETFGRQLIVPKGSKQLADKDVRFSRSFPEPHVGVDKRHLVFPQRVCGEMPLQRHHRVGILFNCVNLNIALGAGGGSQRSGDEGASSSSHHHEERVLRVLLGLAHAVQQRLAHRFFVHHILGVVLLKCLVRLILEVVHQRLQRRLEVVAVGYHHLLVFIHLVHAAEQVHHVLPVGSHGMAGGTPRVRTGLRRAQGGEFLVACLLRRGGGALHIGRRILLLVRQNHLDVVFEAEGDEVLVALAKRGVAALVGGERAGGQDHCSQRLADPSLQGGGVREGGSNSQAHSQRRVALAHDAHLVPPNVRVLQSQSRIRVQLRRVLRRLLLLRGCCGHTHPHLHVVESLQDLVREAGEVDARRALGVQQHRLQGQVRGPAHLLPKRHRARLGHSLLRRVRVYPIADLPHNLVAPLWVEE
mmetsp:Transcript_42124/g.80590  ORF Transcript_42124/g.80590 Transcript_42124/m.80590 type:complete len:552 (+) Transcript_42124:376-2031(+)